jgi:glycosyltransferase involved in cell wall biosynthesis
LKVILSHPTGNANVRAAACGFREADLLAQFHTSIACFPGCLLDRLGSLGAFSVIRRRRFDLSLRSVTQTSPWREAGRLTASKVGFTKLSKHERGPFCIDAVYQSLDRKVALKIKQLSKDEAGAVYAYEDGAAFSFQKAKSLGLKCFYDLPTGYWRSARRLLEKELDRWPDWISTMTGFHDSDKKLVRKDRELELADCIFVASQFTAETLRDYPGHLAPVEVIPYGFPPVFQKDNYSNLARGRKLKILFVGKLTQQKGIADLFAAVEPLSKHVELTVIGQKPTDNCSALDSALIKHRWIPTLNHEDVLQYMRRNDVLIFPSLFDGFGLVMTEAMSQGTPVIASDRSAGPSLIKHGYNGWLVEAGSVFTLQEAIEELLDHPHKIKAAGKEAMKTADSRPWDVYKKELAEAVRKHLNQKF